MNYSIKILVFIFLISTFLCLSSVHAMADDISDKYYSTVKIKGLLARKSGGFYLGNHLRVDRETIKLETGYVEIIGVLLPASGKIKGVLIPLKIKKLTEMKPKIKKYEKPIKIEGKKARGIQQHPIKGKKWFHSYFNGLMGQIVIYFSNKKRYDHFDSLPPGAPVTLTGKLFPAFVFPKRPGVKERKKVFYGFQMEVLDFKTDAKPMEKKLELHKIEK